MKGWRKDGKSYILCAVVLMSMVLAFPAWAGAKGPGEAAHVENEGRSEGEAAAEVGQDAAKTPADLGITDPEYYLWQYVYRPGEAYSLTPAPDGNLKSSYPEDLPGIREFLKGSDWIHKTEEQRFWLIYDRLSVGRHGNTGEAGQNGETAYAFSVLNMGKGLCKNYAADIRRIAQFMGLEAVTYDHSYLHRSAMVKVNGQWMAVDGSIDTTNGTPVEKAVYPVDFDTEYHRYERECQQSSEYQQQQKQREEEKNWDAKLFAGEITWFEYYRKLYTNLSDEELRALYSDMDLDSRVGQE